MSEEFEKMEFVGGENVKGSFVLKDLDSGHVSQWCPGCGNNSIILAIKKAIIKLGINPKDVLVVSGIGCSSKAPHYLKTYGIETIHGRALPVATGAKLANKDLHVIVVGGDGDGYGIGMGHLMHAMRRNINLTYVVFNNQIYALTKGQTSPTTKKGAKTPSTPFGAIETEVNPINLALCGGATFIAKGFSADVEGMSDLIAKGMEHKGFSLVDVAQICVSMNASLDFNWYNDKIYKIEEAQGYNPKDKFWGMKQAEDEGEKIGVGVWYENDTRETYIDDLPEDRGLPLVKQDIHEIDVEGILNNYE